MTLFDQLHADAVAFKAARDEAVIRRLLGHWVSGLEPTIVYAHDFTILGLAGPNGMIVINR